MTTNQTIDGVPRELLERICAIDNDGRTQVQHHYDLIELRALLNAPAKLPLVNVHDGRLIAALRKRLAELETAHPQGEPVAWQHRVTAGPQTGWSLWAPGRGKEYAEHYTVEVRPLYAEQPQAVAVACSHEWTDDGEFTLTCTRCGKKENHEPYGWVQTRGNAINHFTQEWDVVQEWEDSGFEYKAMYDRPELSGSEDFAEYGPTPGCKQCEEAEACGFTDCPECDAQLHEDVNGTGFQPRREPT